jgi:hypothetical protein
MDRFESFGRFLTFSGGSCWVCGTDKVPGFTFCHQCALDEQQTMIFKLRAALQKIAVDDGDAGRIAREALKR